MLNIHLRSYIAPGSYGSASQERSSVWMAANPEVTQPRNAAHAGFLPKWSAPAGRVPGRGCRFLPSGDELPLGLLYSAKGPISRILSCAVIPLDAALPRTFISDLPGGFGKSLNTPATKTCRRGPLLRPAWTHRADAQRCLDPGWRFPPYLVLLRVGFTLTPAFTD